MLTVNTVYEAPTSHILNDKYFDDFQGGQHLVVHVHAREAVLSEGQSVKSLGLLASELIQGDARRGIVGIDAHLVIVGTQQGIGLEGRLQCLFQRLACLWRYIFLTMWRGKRKSIRKNPDG